MFYLLYRIGQKVALTLPPKIAYWLADILGSLYYLLAKNDRKVATNNIKVVLNHTNSRRKICQTSRMIFVNFARYLVEFFRTPKIDLKYIKEHIKIEGRGNLDAALNLGRGALLTSAHLGNWELGATVLAMLGYKLNLIVWTHQNRSINDFFLQQRQSKGIKAIPLGASIRKVFSALKNNELVAVLADIDYLQPESGIKVEFFGRDTIMPKGPAFFSLKAACPIIPTFVSRENSKFRLVLEKPIMPKISDNREDDLISLTQSLAKRIEFYIAQYPAQWFMLTPRWQA